MQKLPPAGSALPDDQLVIRFIYLNSTQRGRAAAAAGRGGAAAGAIFVFFLMLMREVGAQDGGRGQMCRCKWGRVFAAAAVAAVEMNGAHVLRPLRRMWLS